MSKIFLIGATGHIGGAVLDQITNTYPEIPLTALIRDVSKAAVITSRYPNVQPVIGNLASLELLETTARGVDIVINAAPDLTHEAGIKVILKGLSGREKKPFYIQTSGAALIWDAPDGSEPGTKVWDDIADIDAITSMPDGTIHRSTDKLVFASSSSVNVTIVSPTAVYGLSPSPIHPFPLTLPEILNAINSLSSGFTISVGLNLQSYVHVLDLARLYILLLSHALNPTSATTSFDIWGPKAYYFGATDETSFLDFMTSLVDILVSNGTLHDTQLQKINVNQAAKASGAATGIAPPDSWAGYIAVMLGVDMRVRASRAKALGWEMRETGVIEGLQHVVGKYRIWKTIEEMVVAD